jgi:hypothetical protein
MSLSRHQAPKSLSAYDEMTSTQTTSEQNFTQYIEQRPGGKVARYGSNAFERSRGEEVLESGREEWEQNLNNSSVDCGDALNSTISTSSYSTRCTIL